MARKDVWFRYQVTPGRISGAPVSWQGWLVLLALVAAPLLLLGLIAPWLKSIGPLALLGGLLVVFAVIFPTIIAVMRAKGERVN